MWKTAQNKQGKSRIFQVIANSGMEFAKPGIDGTGMH